MKKDPIVFLKHIQVNAQFAEKYLHNKTRERFYKDFILQDAVARRLEIVGEATKNLPLSLRKKHSDVPWTKIIGMRNILVHEYFGVNYEVLWNTVKDVLPAFRKQIEKILEESEQRPLI